MSSFQKAQPDAACVFADFASALDYDSIPADVVACTKKLILDQLGVMLVGASAAGVPELAASVRQSGGTPESSVIGYGFKAPAAQAAMVNGAMARAQDYDALHERGIVHITAGSLPQCLALSEYRGGVSGKEFITAMTAGMEFMIRLGLSFKTSFLKTGRVTTLHQATFGGALIGAKLLGLDQRQTVSALGLAYGQVAGNLQVTVEGTMLVRVLQGFAAQTAVQSALLAKHGLVGPERVLQGEWGYFKAYHDNQYDADALTRDLGTHFELPDVSIKFYPCCFLSHFAIDAILQLMREEGLRADNVDAIHVRVTQGTYNVVCSPAESKRQPQTMEAALFSLPYCVAAALMQGDFGLPQMTMQSIRDVNVQAMAQRITTAVDAELERAHGVGIGPSIVEAKLRNGSTLTRRVDYCKGHPRNPMQFDDCAEKFRRCAAFAARPLPAQSVEKIITLIAHLEQLEDINRIISIMR
ncbi:MAG: MmgE/PrpD family protein [Burkholderiales bacterium]